MRAKSAPKRKPEETAAKPISWASQKPTMSMSPFEYSRLHDIAGALEELSQASRNGDSVSSCLGIMAQKFLDLLEQIYERSDEAQKLAAEAN